MAYPTTLALITALWSGPPRTKSIALWSGTGGAIASLGPLVAGALLEHFYWGSVFLITLPLAVVALVFAAKYIPSHVNETSDRVDNLGWRPVRRARRQPHPGHQLRARAQRGSTGGRPRHHRRSGRHRVRLRQRRARTRCTTCTSPADACSGWRRVPASSCSGRSWARCSSASSSCRTCWATPRSIAGAAILPAAILMVLVAPRSAKLVGARRRPLHVAHRVRLRVPGLLDDAAALEGGQLLLAGGPGLRVRRGGRRFRRDPGVAFAHRVGAGAAGRDGVGTADLQRDLGGAVMQSIFGALLTAGFATAMGAAIAASPDSSDVTSSVQSELTKSFSTRRRHRRALPPVRQPDHGGREVVVPRRRRLGLRRRHRRCRPRSHARLLHVPEEARRRRRCSRSYHDDSLASFAIASGKARTGCSRRCCLAAACSSSP